jgi:peroxiredoxin
MKKNGFVNCLYRLFPILMVLVANACGPSTNAGPGNSAPAFTLQAIRGGEYRLQDLLEQPILLAFINTQADGGSATSDPSRAQIVFLKSMREQYDSKGLTVLIVDAAGVATGKHPSHDKLINFSYDWQLDNIPVLDDPDGSVARAYGVKSTPVTFLIGADGIIQQRWDGFASASQLALSIEALVGAPAHRQVDTAETLVTPPTVTCPNEAQPQAKFSGVGLARSLSDELWVVDGGGPWGTGAAFPVQWILIDTQNLTQQAPLHVEVLGQYINTQQIFPLSDQPLELLPTDVASGLLSGDVTPPKIYSLVTTVFLERAGCLEIRAVVTSEGSTIPLYQGSLVISAR